MATVQASGLTKIIGERELLQRGLVPAGAGRPHGALGPQRLGQDDAAAHPRGRGLRRSGPRLAGQGRARGPPRPAPARAIATDARATTSSAARLGARDRARAGRARGADGHRLERGDARRLRGRPGPLRGRRRLPLARRGAGDRPRARLRRARARARPLDVLGRRADPRVACPRARGEAGPPSAGRADQPPGHRLARVARATTWARWTRRSSWSRTTAGSWNRSATRCSSWSEGRPKFFAGPWHEWRIEKAARELFLGRDAKRREADIARHRALRRALPGQEHAGAPGEVEAEADRAHQARGAGASRGGRASLAFSFGEAQRSGKVVLEMEGATHRGRRSARCSRTASCGSSGASTSA